MTALPGALRYSVQAGKLWGESSSARRFPQSTPSIRDHIRSPAAWSARAAARSSTVRTVPARITIWKARAGFPRGPGSIGAVGRAAGPRVCVNCGEGSREVLEYEMDGARRPRVGERLDPMERAA